MIISVLEDGEPVRVIVKRWIANDLRHLIIRREIVPRGCCMHIALGPSEMMEIENLIPAPVPEPIIYEGEDGA